MGQAESNESAAVKRQAEGGEVPMYKLLDLSGGGLLFHITKRCMIKKDYKELDEALKQKIPPFLYNGGKGAMVPIAQLCMLRNRDRSPRKYLPPIKELGEEAAFSFVFEGSDLLAKVTEGLDPEKSPHLFRECCWMVEQRGFVGETVFHVCFLMGTQTHLVCGRRMLKWYPKLINDVYLSEEYYGENVLHMSAVAEDPTMVKYLLEEGVDIHERAYGNFFCPEDQKASRNDSLDHEEVDVCVSTNYDGYVYWGEYPLCFAAVLNQEECYRLILSKGANHDLQDTNGNTITHIMVIYDNMKMFDLAVECGAAINILNNQQLTPLSTASFLARTEMFFHIANLEREVYWQIGNVTCSAYPIEQLDSINSKTGELNVVSALNLIVFGKKVEHLDLIEGIIVDILKTKWKSFVSRSFWRQSIAFTIFFSVAMLAFCLRHHGDTLPECGTNSTLAETNSTVVYGQDTLTAFTLATYDTGTVELSTNDSYDSLSGGFTAFPEGKVTNDAIESTLAMDHSDMAPTCFNGTDGKQVIYEDACYLHKYDSPRYMIRLACEIFVVIGSFIYMFIALKEMTYVPRNIYFQSLALCPSRCVFLTGCLCTVLMIPCRLACWAKAENNFAIYAATCIPMYFLFFCRGFKSTGPFVTMIYRMMAADLLRFVIIYSIFVMGFSQGFYIVFITYDPGEDGDDNPMGDPMESIIVNFILSMGNFGDPWEQFADTEHKLCAQTLCFIFLSVVFVMLVNLLIAMMGDTYTKIAEIKNEWMRQWARVVLLIERQISPKQRLIEQNNYSEYMATGEKALILKQTMSEEQLEEIKDIIEMKVAHRRNIDKRRVKYGYESGSLIGMNLGATNVIAPDADECYEE